VIEMKIMKKMMISRQTKRLPYRILPPVKT